MLFSIVAEALTNIILRVQDLALLSGFKASNSNEPIPISQSTDDTLLMVDSRTEDIKNKRAILLWFEEFASLRMNVLKTKLFKVNEGHALAHEIQDWGCSWETLPSSYLGLPLAAGYTAKIMWRPLINRFRQ